MIIVELNEIKDLDVREINIASVPSASQISAVAGTSSSKRFSTVPQGSGLLWRNTQKSVSELHHTSPYKVTQGQTKNQIWTVSYTECGPNQVL